MDLSNSLKTMCTCHGSTYIYCIFFLVGVVILKLRLSLSKMISTERYIAVWETDIVIVHPGRVVVRTWRSNGSLHFFRMTRLFVVFGPFGTFNT